MKKIIFSLCLLGIICSFHLAADARCNVARIPQCDTPPVLDGIFSPEEWDQAAALSSYCSMEELISQHPTLTYAMYDEENLYIGFATGVDFYIAGTEEAFPHDEMQILTRDAFSMNFKHIGTNYCRRFVVDKQGSTMDCTESFGETGYVMSWEPEWKFATSMIPGAFQTNLVWFVEAAIPWTTLELTPVQGLEFGAQFVHYYGKGATAGHRVATWTPYTNPWGIFGFGGDFILGGKDWPCFQFDSYAPFSNGQCGVSGWLTQPGNTQIDFEFEGTQFTAQKNIKKMDSINIYAVFPVPLQSSDVATGQWFLSDEHGLIAGARFRTPVDPPFKFSILPLEYPEEVCFLGDLKEYGTLPEDSELVFELIRQDGSVVDSLRQKADSLYSKVCLSQKNIPAGETFTARVQLRLNDIMLEESKTQLTRNSRPEWIDFDGGYFTSPDPATGWYPVVADGDEKSRTYRILDNEISFQLTSPMPQSIKIKGQQFTCDQIRFLVDSGNGQETFTARALEETVKDGRGYTLRYQGFAPSGTALTADIRIEFDGLIYYAIKIFSPSGSPLTIHHAALEFNIRPDAIRYAKASDGDIYNTSFVGKGKVTYPVVLPDLPYEWTISTQGYQGGSRYMPYYQLGDENGGIFFVQPDKRNLSIGGAYTEAVETDDAFQFVINFIDTTTQFSDSCDFEFGLMITPSRKPTSNKIAWRSMMYGEAFSVSEDKSSLILDPSAWKIPPFEDRFLLQHQDKDAPLVLPKGYLNAIGIQIYDAQIGNPFLNEQDTAHLKKFNKMFAEEFAVAPMLWYDSTFTMVATEELSPFCNDWEISPRARIQVERFGGPVCPTKAWQNCYLWGVNNYMDMGSRGFYMDLSGLLYCKNLNHGHGWRDSNGEIQPELPFLEMREFFLRYQHLIKSRDPHAFLYLHGGSISPVALWQDMMLWGEEWSQAPDLSTLSPELYQALYMAKSATGVPLNLLVPHLVMWYQEAKTSGVTMEEAMGLAYIHGESVHVALTAHLPGQIPAWQALEDFGIEAEDCTFVPYFANTRNCYPENVAVSSYQRGNRELLLIFNPAYESKIIPEKVFDGLSSLQDELGNAMGDLETINSRGFRIISGGKKP